MSKPDWTLALKAEIGQVTSLVQAPTPCSSAKIFSSQGHHKDQTRQHTQNDQHEHRAGLTVLLVYSSSNRRQAKASEGLQCTWHTGGGPADGLLLPR